MKKGSRSMSSISTRGLSLLFAIEKGVILGKVDVIEWSISVPVRTIFDDGEESNSFTRYLGIPKRDLRLRSRPQVYERIDF